MNPSRIHNAYRDWLGIDSPSTATHYQLLGIPSFESNLQAIVSGYGTRTTQVSAHLNGPDTDVASRVLGDLAAAQACLLDAPAKAIYDGWLKQQIPSEAAAQSHASSTGYHRPAPRDDAATAPVAMPTASTAALGTSASMPSQTASTINPPVHKFDHGRSSKGRADEPISALPWLIGGVCAGLLGVCVLALVLFGTRDRTTIADADRENTPIVHNPIRNSVDRPRQTTNTSVQQPRISDEHVAPPTNPGDRLTWTDAPVPADGDVLDLETLESPSDSSSSDGPATDPEPAPEVPAAQPTLRLAEVPRAVALPRRNPDDLASIAPAVLSRVNVKDVQEVKLELVSGPPAGGSGHFELTPRDAPDAAAKTWDVQHVADGAAAASVGQYTLADGELTFAWSPDVDAQAQQQLANQPLKITAGDEVATIAQREAQQTAPIVVKVDAGAVGSTISVENPPESADIVVAIDELGDEFGEYTWEPSSTIAVGKSATLRFGGEQDAFQLALEISAEQAGLNRFRIESRPMFRSFGTKKWDYFRPKQAAEALATLQQQQGLLDAQMQEIQRRYRRDPVARDQATALHNQQSALLLERIANLERISDRCLELQDKGELHFRVVANTGEAEIELLSTQAKSSNAAAPTEEDGKTGADPNIGAPIEPEADPVTDPPADPVPALP